MLLGSGTPDVIEFLGERVWLGCRIEISWVQDEDSSLPHRIQALAHRQCFAAIA
jgi:hypothetical protein